MLDILIVDDEVLARQRLQRMVVDLGYEVAGEAKNAAEAMTLIEQLDPAVVLLDIEMPGETGIQLAERVSHLDQPPVIIFTTAYDHYALEAFDYSAVGYLVKPINREKLSQVLEKAQTLNKAQLATLDNTVGQAVMPLPSQISQAKHISVHSHRGINLIEIESIRCFVADSKYITVQGTQGECLLDGTLTQLETEFAPHFLRIHRNALISVAHVTGLERMPEGGYRVCLEGVDFCPTVSRRYTKKVKDFLDTL
jgi:two-component system, LytTR family, response regulator AlgR